MKTGDYPHAEAARETGIESSADHAEIDMPGWMDDAVEVTRQYANTRSQHPFLIEDVRYWAKQRGLPEPPERRAWGAVARRASRAGYIVRIGYGSARSSNLSPKVLWIGVI